MEPLDRSYTTYYWSSYLTLNYHDLEMWVRGHSRSLKVVPFESLGTVSSSPIVTMAVSFAISEILASKNGLTLKSEFEVVQGHFKRRSSTDHV